MVNGPEDYNIKGIGKGGNDPPLFINQLMYRKGLLLNFFFHSVLHRVTES